MLTATVRQVFSDTRGGRLPGGSPGTASASRQTCRARTTWERDSSASTPIPAASSTPEIVSTRPRLPHAEPRLPDALGDQLPGRRRTAARPPRRRRRAARRTARRGGRRSAAGAARRRCPRPAPPATRPAAAPGRSRPPAPARSRPDAEPRERAGPHRDRLEVAEVELGALHGLGHRRHQLPRVGRSGGQAGRRRLHLEAGAIGAARRWRWPRSTCRCPGNSRDRDPPAVAAPRCSSSTRRNPLQRRWARPRPATRQAPGSAGSRRARRVLHASDPSR